MSRTRFIVLPNPGPFLTTFVMVHFRDCESGFDITRVELYADAEATKPLNDDVQITEQSPEFQAKVYAALSNEPVRTERGKRRLWRDLQTDLQADVAAARAWH